MADDIKRRLLEKMRELRATGDRAAYEKAQDMYLQRYGKPGMTGKGGRELFKATSDPSAVTKVKGLGKEVIDTMTPQKIKTGSEFAREIAEKRAKRQALKRAAKGVGKGMLKQGGKLALAGVAGPLGMALTAADALAGSSESGQPGISDRLEEMNRLKKERDFQKILGKSSEEVESQADTEMKKMNLRKRLGLNNE